MPAQAKAFFYEYKYYLFPDGSDLAGLRNSRILHVRRLREEGCMAPDFIYESVTEEELEIEAPDRLFEVRVNLYSKEEYDARLGRQVRRVCPGCERYTDDGSAELRGHHREISLSGVCFERSEPSDRLSFARCGQIFWERVAARLNELAVCIDKGDQRTFNRILGTELRHFMIRIPFYGASIGGTYCICFHPDVDYVPIVYSMIVCLVKLGSSERSPITKRGWKVLPCIPYGIYVPKGEGETSDNRKIVRAEPYYGGLLFTLYHPRGEEISDQTRRRRVAAFADRLICEFGEAQAIAMVGGVAFSAEKEGMMTVREMLDFLRRKQETEGFSSEFPPACSYSCTEEAETPLLPYRDLIKEGMTLAPDLAALVREDVLNPPWWTGLVSFAYLYIPRAEKGGEEDSVLWYLSNTDRIPEPIRAPEEDEAECATGIGAADCGERGILVDELVTDEKRFFRTLRILAPVLQAYHVKVVVVNGDGVSVYECGYDFTLVDE